MKWARIKNGMAVDVRGDAPHGKFVESVAAEFVEVPDDVQDGSILTNGAWVAPVPPPPPDYAKDAHNADLDAQIAALAIPFTEEQQAFLESIAPAGAFAAAVETRRRLIAGLNAGKR